MLEQLLTGTHDYYYDTGPGPKILKRGNSTIGYYGELAESELISRTNLRTLTNFTSGTDNTTWDNKWIKLAVLGKIVYIPSARLALNVSRRQLNTAGYVPGVEKAIQGYNFKVRLPYVCTVEPATINTNTIPFEVGSPQYNLSEWGYIVSALLTVPQNTGLPHWNLYDRTNFLTQGDTNYIHSYNTRSGYAGVTLVASNFQASFTGGLDATGAGWLPILELGSKV